jgi:hypothetical protein
MSRPEPILPEKERTILLEVYENPGKQHDTFYFTDTLYFPGMTNPEATRMTPEYIAAFKETVKIIESLVEKGLIDGKQLQRSNIGMYYTELKVKFKGKQKAIREKRRAEELEKQMPDIIKRSNEVVEEIRKAKEKKQAQ